MFTLVNLKNCILLDYKLGFRRFVIYVYNRIMQRGSQGSKNLKRSVNLKNIIVQRKKIKILFLNHEPHFCFPIYTLALGF